MGFDTHAVATPAPSLRGLRRKLSAFSRQLLAAGKVRLEAGGFRPEVVPHRLLGFGLLASGQ
jgi:hypothetical protein